MYYLSGTRWYIAEFIDEVSVGRFPRRVLHRNTRFVFANSPEEVYEQMYSLTPAAVAPSQAIEEGTARIRFWSLAHLNIVREDVTPVVQEIPGQPADMQPNPAIVWGVTQEPSANPLSD